jgi:glycosyltransferase involved in cell wall biosynthesis
MKLHLVSVPHTSTTMEYSWCAFTSLTKSWSNMMHDLGHEVYLYAGPENEAHCTEHINCRNGYEWTERVPPYEANHPGWMAFAEEALQEIRYRYTPGDYICLAGGSVQQPIADAFPDAIVVEPIAGYQGVMNNSFRVFPSRAWMNSVYGHWYSATGADGRFYDAVIPHFLEKEDYPLGDGSGDYLLYVGRLIERKGLKVVADVAERTGLPLVVAGFGDESLIPPGAEFVGSVEPAERARLMGNARCVLMPTLYVEPFGLVAIESQACGTPVITTDFGAFPETVHNGETGYRCNLLREFVEATEKVLDLDKKQIQKKAFDTYSIEVVGSQYDEYFQRLETLKGAGWYAL